jgi:hypothetical protein
LLDARVSLSIVGLEREVQTLRKVAQLFELPAEVARSMQHPDHFDSFGNWAVENQVIANRKKSQIWRKIFA